MANFAHIMGHTCHADPDLSACIEKAAGDMQVAERLLDSNDPRMSDAVCYHSRQRVEVPMKAALVSRGRSFPRAHDLVHLDTFVGQVIASWTLDVKALSKLSSTAFESRHLGFQATEQVAREAFETD